MQSAFKTEKLETLFLPVVVIMIKYGSAVRCQTCIIYKSSKKEPTPRKSSISETELVLINNILKDLCNMQSNAKRNGKAGSRCARTQWYRVSGFKKYHFWVWDGVYNTQTERLYAEKKTIIFLEKQERRGITKNFQWELIAQQQEAGDSIR